MKAEEDQQQKSESSPISSKKTRSKKAGTYQKSESTVSDYKPNKSKSDQPKKSSNLPKSKRPDEKSRAQAKSLPKANAKKVYIIARSYL